ncbi:hypothetical protein C8R43DRAFT_1183382 [Mycena crocata]|nr:hypothetical protein C8R43DRAFT_1183382 [Mycena crocata]
MKKINYKKLKRRHPYQSEFSADSCTCRITAAPTPRIGAGTLNTVRAGPRLAGAPNCIPTTTLVFHIPAVNSRYLPHSRVMVGTCRIVPIASRGVARKTRGHRHRMTGFMSGARPQPTVARVEWMDTARRRWAWALRSRVPSTAVGKTVSTQIREVRVDVKDEGQRSQRVRSGECKRRGGAQSQGRMGARRTRSEGAAVSACAASGLRKETAQGPHPK